MKHDHTDEKSPDTASDSQSAPAARRRGDVLDMVRKLQAAMGVWVINGKKIMKAVHMLEQRVLEEPLLSNSDDE